MRIKNKMIHKELRFLGIVIRAMLPSFTERNIKIINKLHDLFLKGRCKSNINYEQKWISRSDGSKLRVCVYSPKETKENAPGLLWMHGGGYAVGIPEWEEKVITRFVNASGCIVAAVDYRRSVECPYPAALDDCYTALLWLRDHEYKIRKDQLIIGGDSAGGGLTTALSLFARDKKEAAIAFQIPLYPMLDDRMNTESAKDNDAPMWNSKSNYTGWKMYLGDFFETDNVPVYASPARAEDLKNLPPAISFVGDLDPFYDETVIFMNRLRENGIPVFFKVFKGCFHAFDLVGEKTKIGKEAISFLMESFNYAVNHYFAEQPD